MHPVFAHLSHRANDHHVWTHRNSFTGMSTEMIKNAVFFVFLSKNIHKTHEIVKVAVINDNNNFAPSIFWSLCDSSVIVLVLGIFLRELRSLRKIPRPKTITSDFHTMTSKKMVRSYYCRITMKYVVSRMTMPHVRESASSLLYIHQSLIR